MSVIGQHVRQAIRSSQASGRSASSSSGANAINGNASSSASATDSGNGVLLRALDSNSRRSAMGGQDDSAQNNSELSGSDTGSVGNGIGAAGEAIVAVNTAIATDVSGIIASESAIANDSSGLEAAKSAMKDNLTQIASDPKAFHAAMEKSFGKSYDKAKAETIRQQVLDGDFSWMPEIKVVDETVLQDQSGTQTSGKALGAYSKDNDTIYISAQLLKSDPDKATQILTEEVGHGLDTRLNTSDAAGDEGDIFSRIVGGEEISDVQLTDLKAENDSGVIIVDGKEVEVEYGLFSGIKKGFKKLGKSIKKGVKKLGKTISKGLKKIAQSKWFNTIMTIAQFIPIPIVQVIVRVVNVARAAYAVYQGVKHGSIGMVLSGVAGVAGNVSGIGSALGSSAKIFTTAGKIAKTAGKLGAAYKAVSEKDFAAAAGLASNYFGGSATSTGRAFGAAGNVVTAVDKYEGGDILGAVQSGRAAYTGFTSTPDTEGTSATRPGNKETSADGEVSASSGGRVQGFVDNVSGFVDRVQANETFIAIRDNVDTIRGIAKAVKAGNYSEATSTFLTNYADDLGISDSNQKTINKWASVVETVVDTKEMVDKGDYSGAIGEAAGMLGIPLSQNNQTRLDTVFQIRDSVRGDKYATASRQAAALALQSGEPKLAANFLRLANLLEGKLPNKPAEKLAVTEAA